MPPVFRRLFLYFGQRGVQPDQCKLPPPELVSFVASPFRSVWDVHNSDAPFVRGACLTPAKMPTRQHTSGTSCAAETRIVWMQFVWKAARSESNTGRSS